MSKTTDAAEEEYSVEKVLNRRVRNGKVSVISLFFSSFLRKIRFFVFYCCCYIMFGLSVVGFTTQKMVIVVIVSPREVI